MITIRADWTLDVPEEERGIGWAGENEVERRVFVLPEGYGEDWVYRLDLRLADGSADIGLLEPEEGTLTWEITGLYSTCSPPLSVMAEAYSCVSSSGVLAEVPPSPPPEHPASRDRARAAARARAESLIFTV